MSEQHETLTRLEGKIVGLQALMQAGGYLETKAYGELCHIAFGLGTSQQREQEVPSLRATLHRFGCSALYWIGREVTDETQRTTYNAVILQVLAELEAMEG